MTYFHLRSAITSSLLLAAAISAQQTPVRSTAQPIEGTVQAIAPNLWRVEGDDGDTSLHYVRLLLQGASAPPTGRPQAAAQGSSASADFPALTAQCTREPGGKLHFELFANFGGVSDLTFYPPWHSTGPNDLFPPRTTRIQLTMEFLGYTKVKPFKRAWEQVVAPGPEQLRYLNPGAGSANMELPGYWFQYLRALPILRLSGNGHGAEFLTTAWLAQLRKEPVCAASGA